MRAFTTEPLGGMPWKTPDPFLFCVYHNDAYPAGTPDMGPNATLEGRAIGHDFEGIDGWRMYHGEKVPGFPQHPHRGFETVTVVRRGLIDHSDSLGATARFGQGDVQWLTAGRGILHSEMMPLIETTKPNPLELFQIWLNLPRVDKMAEPHFAMLWNHEIPRHIIVDEAGKKSELTVVAGRFRDETPAAPPPKSWASRKDTDVAIWTIKMEPGAKLELPRAQAGSNRSLYFYRGSRLSISGDAVASSSRIIADPEAVLVLQNGDDDAEILVLQGKPIAEPVVQHGPFVMNSQQEIMQTFLDYQKTQFGGWRWPSDEPVHPRESGRFARHADGREERPAR
jgi:quercetin 2,3-dioxygenase